MQKTKNMEDKKQKIFDVFLFLNELDLLEIRLETLFPIVDYFIITEINETFSGKPKKLIFEKNKNRFKKYLKKIIYNPVTKIELEKLKSDKWVNYISDFNISLKHKHSARPARNIQSSLQREIMHRDSAILGFFNLASHDDFILLSDLDEIPNPKAIIEIVQKKISKPHYFRMNWYLYWINNKISKPWFGTVMFYFKDIKGSSLDNLRLASSNEDLVPGLIVNDGGWHFSYLGGSEAIKEKLYAHPFQGYKAQLAILLDKFKIRSIKKTLKNNRDLLFQNRNLSIIEIDENFPPAILHNQEFINKYSYNFKDSKKKE